MRGEDRQEGRYRMKIRESERAAKKLGELLISFSIDPRIFKQFLGQYIDGQQLPLPQRRDIALSLVMVLMRLARDEY